MPRSLANRFGAVVTLCVGFTLAPPLSLAQQQDASPRLWKDASGKFQIEATLLGQTPTAVRLRAPNGREISVPLERLSSDDLQYLQSLASPQDNPFAAGMAPHEAAADTASPIAAGTFRSAKASSSAGDTLALPDTGRTLDLSAEPESDTFVPDAGAALPQIPSAVVPISKVDPYDKVGAPVPIDDSGKQYFVSVYHNKINSPEETRGRVYAVGLADKTTALVWDRPSAMWLLDHDIASGRSLAVDGLDHAQRGGELVMIDQLATGNPQPLYRRTLPGAGKPGFAPQVQWARLLSGSHAAVIIDGTLLVWDLAAAQLVYRVDKVSATEPPVFSANQVYMAIPQPHAVVLLHTATGAVQQSIPTGTSLRPGISFNTAGRLLAACFSNQYLVWDCQENRVVTQATTTDHLGAHPVHWVGPKMLLGAHGDAIDLELGMSVWKYSRPPGPEPLVRGGRLLTATSSQQCDLVSVEVPDAAAEKAARDLRRAGDAAMLVRPGSAVEIAVETVAGGNEAEIKASLAEAAEKAGWMVSERAPVALVAKIGRGEPQELKFRMMGKSPGSESTATLTPFTAELQIRRGADVLWTRATTNHIPMILRLEEGETVQDAVHRYEKPDATFFSILQLPPRIPKPEIATTVGRSTLRDGEWHEIKTPPAGPRRRR